MKIKEVSERTGVSRRTLQYYDDEGLLSVHRTPCNHRMYGEEALKRLWRILLYKEMGFSLKEIKELLSVSGEERRLWFIRQTEKLQSQIARRQERMRLISLVQTTGIPPLPDCKDGRSYYAELIRLRENPNGNEMRRK